MFFRYLLKTINLPELQKVTFNVDFRTEFQFIGKAPYVFSPLNARASKGYVLLEAAYQFFQGFYFLP
jgi:hypothetical protein